MLRKIWTVFIRDIKVNTREVLSLFIFILPLIFAIAINVITPGINDTTVNVAMVRNEDPAREEFFGRFAKVGLYDNASDVQERVEKRDAVFGIVTEGGVSVIVMQGNETASLLDYAKLINVLYESDIPVEESDSRIIEFGRSTPPVKKIMVNILLLFISVFAGMLIALNILEEKTDHTVRAMNVSPISKTAFVLGKSITGMLFSLFWTVACLLITGFGGINIGQAVVVIAVTSVLSMIIGFAQGINSNDVMEAAGSVKLMFLPLGASIIGYELLKSKWHIFLYWSPFYWAYRANDMILSESGTWLQLLLYAGAIVLLCAVIYSLLLLKIRKGLQ
ncbi:MAG: ABC transporter permease [Clostridia bacterium]|jgi:ABC-type multidrug transport system permease subunit